MKPAHTLLFLVVTLLSGLASCSCPDAPTLERYGTEDLATPEGALLYFSEAVRRGDAYHQYLCFSQEMKDANPDLTVSNLSQYQEKIKEFVKEEVGSLDDLEVNSTRYVRSKPWIALVEVTDSNRTETVQMVQETTYTVSWADGSYTHGGVPTGGTPFRIRGSRLSADLGISEKVAQDPKVRVGDVHRVIVNRDWKILGTTQGPFAESLRKKLDGEAEPAKPKSKPKPRTRRPNRGT